MSKKHREQRQGAFSGAAPSSPPDSPSESEAAVDEELPSEPSAAEPEAETPSSEPEPVLEAAPTPEPEPVKATPPPVVAKVEPVEAVLVPTERPTHDEFLAAIKAGKSVEVRILPPLTRGKVAGLPVDLTPRVFPLSQVANCGPSYVRALVIDESIHVRIVDAEV
jgi:hypothetical protein